MPRFSIIVPIYKSGKFLPWTLDSLLAQTFQDWEAILVDDGSDQPELTAIIEAAADSDQRFRAVPLSPNSGVSAARNHGLKEALGEYLIFLDSDDLFLPWTLQVYDEVISRENNPAFLVGRATLLSADESRAVSEISEVIIEKYADYLAYWAVVEHWWFNPSGTTVRADEIRKISGFWQSRELCEDIDFWLRLGTASGFVRIMEPRIYAYRLHDGGAHHGYHTLYRGLNRMILAEKEDWYPGGKPRARERIGNIASHARHNALAFAATEPALAWKLYFRILPWNFWLGRWKFLIGFPFIAAVRLFKR